MNFLNRSVTIGLVLWLCSMVGRKGPQLLRLLQPDGAAIMQARTSRHWKELISEHAPVLGTRTARFKIVEFSDYQCPFCAAAEPILATFVARHRSEAALFRYDFPLETIHRYAYAAALAADCAEMQGIAAPYQSLLFAHRNEFPTLDWAALARQSGIGNAAAFASCLRDKSPRDRIRKDIARGKEQIGITATPTFIVNGNLVKGPLSDRKLEALYRNLDHPENNGLLDRFSAALSN